MTHAGLLVPLLLLAACASSPAPVEEHPDPLTRLMEGNARFVAGEPRMWGALRERRAEVAREQRPFAIVLGCCDSRTAPEQVFDRTVGDLYVVRTAGNVTDDIGLGSMEYGVDHLHASLLVVLGHERCGAVSAAIEAVNQAVIDAGESFAVYTAKCADERSHIGAIVTAVAPSVAEALQQPGDPVDNAVRTNVRSIVAFIRRRSPVLAELEHEGKLKIVGAHYDLDTGRVTILE